MKSEKKKLGILTRSYEVDRASVDDESRTVELSFSSEEPVERWFGYEILDHEKKSIRLDRINGRAPLLLEHDRRDQVGVVESASVKNRRGTARVRFGNGPRASEIFEDVKNGIRSLVSVGYRIHKLVTEKVEEGVETLRATDWEPMEISIVSIPADTSVGVGRDADNTETLIERKAQEKIMGEENKETPPENKRTAPAPDIEVIKEQERKNTLEGERNRMRDIRKAAEGVEKIIPKARELAEKAIEDGKTVQEFQRTLNENWPEQRDINSGGGEIGMGEKDKREFSLLRALRQLSVRGKLDGLEKEVHEATMKNIGREVKENSIVVPDDITHYRRMPLNGQRAQLAGTATAGGFTVETEVGPMIELLRNRTVLGQAGVQVITGLKGDLSLPKHVSGATAYWVDETGALTDSESTFGQVKATPHRLGATVPYSTQFLAQTSLSAEQFIRDDLMRVLAIEKDRAGLHGTGAGGEPLGIESTTGINKTVTFGGAATWADVVEFETGIEADNADVGSMGFILSTATKGKWKTILRDSVAGAAYLIQDGGTINGYPYQWTNQITGNIVFFGVFGMASMLSWTGMEFIVDPYSLKKSGQVEITVNELCDFVVRQPLAFNLSTDSGAQ